MKITITGVTGFIGQNLIKNLLETADLRSLSIRYILNQTFDLKGGAVIHLGGKAHDLKKNPIHPNITRPILN